jgi:NifB/MoaA-like Fe-S oxidoreductase
MTKVEKKMKPDELSKAQELASEYMKEFTSSDISGMSMSRGIEFSPFVGIENSPPSVLLIGF